MPASIHKAGKLGHYQKQPCPLSTRLRPGAGGLTRHSILAQSQLARSQWNQPGRRGLGSIFGTLFDFFGAEVARPTSGPLSVTIR
jgi:hypothetical protein